LMVDMDRTNAKIRNRDTQLAQRGEQSCRIHAAAESDTQITARLRWCVSL
jgi:hypothetical protein